MYVYAYDRIQFHFTICNSLTTLCNANLFLVAAILVCVMKEISFENCYTFFKGMLPHVNLRGSPTAPIYDRHTTVVYVLVVGKVKVGRCHPFYRPRSPGV
jgi:hypothetical protein